MVLEIVYYLVILLHLLDKKYIYAWNVMLNMKLQHMQSMLFQ
jgi:hypothetical protein